MQTHNRGLSLPHSCYKTIVDKENLWHMNNLFTETTTSNLKFTLDEETAGRGQSGTWHKRQSAEIISHPFPRWPFLKMTILMYLSNPFIFTEDLWKWERVNYTWNSLKLDSHSISKHFSTLSSELKCFHSDSTLPLSDKMLMQSVFRRPIESCVMSVKCSWNWTFFKLWSGIVLKIAFWYQSIG